MKKIEFFSARNLPFRIVGHFAPESFLKPMTDSDKLTEVKTHFPGDEKRPSLMEIVEIANAEATLHSHEKDEIFYVLEGEMHFGSRACSAGDSISIAGGTQYRFRSGPDGCRYLKFTGAADHSFIAATRSPDGAIT